MKKIFIMLLVVLGVNAQAQVSKVSLQASGLTCSMCSNSIYKSLKTLPFVEKIEANIKTSTFEIKFKPAAQVDFNKLKAKVEDAGYAVAKFVATIDCENVQVKTNEPVRIGAIKLQFIQVKEQALNGEKPIKIVSKGFVPLKEFKKLAVNKPAAADVYLATM